MAQLTKFTKPASAVTVPLLDLTRQYQPLAAEIIPILEKICASQQFILGRHVLEFERAAASYCNCAHAVGVSSGTDALLLALMALGIGAGAEVITTPHTFFATAGTIARAGARPVFELVERRNFNLDPATVREFLQRQCERRGGKLINRRNGAEVRALMPVHLYGQCADMAPLLQLGREFGLKVIEDAAQAIGADYVDGRRAGSMGDIGCLSFFPTKNLGAFGDAGMCTAQDAELADHMRVLRVHGSKPKYHHAFVGGNFRLDEIQAAVLGVKLRLLDAWTAARERNAAFYKMAFGRAALSGQIQLPAAAALAILFPPWIQAMALFASANGMEAVTIFTTPAFFQYGAAAGADAPEETAYISAVNSAIAQGELTPTGQAYLTYSQQLGIKVATSLSSASYATLPSVFNPNCGTPTDPCNADATVAPDELVSAFGADLAASSAPTPSAGFPTTLAGTTVTLVDISNTSYPVPLDFVSPGQVNYVVPSAAQPGAAALTITSADGTKTTGVVLVAAVDPGLYAANATGKGAPAGFAVCAGICAGWPGPPNQYGQFVQDLSKPISLRVATDTVVLALFGPGLRHVASPSAVTATINGQGLPVQFAGAQGQFTGEDQINVQLPYNLSASGMVNLVLTTTVDQGALALYDTDITPSSNTVTIDIE